MIAPPYDVIDDDAAGRARGRSKLNVVEIDLPRANGGDPYEHAAETVLEAGTRRGARPRGRAGDLGATPGVHGPRWARPARHGFFARVRVEDYGPGRIRPHERTHPGPKEDRLRLTRATRTNLSPIFSLFPDPDAEAGRTLEAGMRGEPVRHGHRSRGHAQHALAGQRRRRDGHPPGSLADAELLIADGHHRYETARVYADEIGGEGEHRYVLMLPLLALGSRTHGLPHPPPAHRAEGRPGQAGGDPRVLTRDFDVEELAPRGARAGRPATGVRSATWTRFHKKPYR